MLCSNSLNVNLQLSTQSVAIGASMSISWGGRQLSFSFRLPPINSVWQLVEEVRLLPTGAGKIGACCGPIPFWYPARQGTEFTRGLCTHGAASPSCPQALNHTCKPAQIVAAALGAAKQDHPAISNYVPCPAAVITCPAGQGIARAAAGRDVVVSLPSCAACT